MANWKFKQGESHNVYFVIQRNGVLVDVSGATASFAVKKHKTDTSAIISKADAAFDKSSATSGTISVRLSGTDTGIAAGKYIGELKLIFAQDIDISEDIYIEIESSNF